MDRVVRGELDDDTFVEKEKGGVQEEEMDSEVDLGQEPPPQEFILELPNITAIDLCVSPHSEEWCSADSLVTRDIMKLTALFTARRGRSFLNSLQAKEGRNYQFDFLKPTHSLFAYFNQLIEQYTKVLLPNKEMLEQLNQHTQPSAKWEMLEEAKRHAKWEQRKREQEKKREDDMEAERSAFISLSLSTSPTCGGCDGVC